MLHICYADTSSRNTLIMSNHFTDQEINGYIHRTLSDVQRETMLAHANRCEQCHLRLRHAEQWRREIANNLDMELRYARPSSDMQFSQIQGEISRKRKFAFFRFHSFQMVGTVGKFALAILGIAFAMTMFSSASQGAPLVQANPAPAMFPEAWDDPSPYQETMIVAEQPALESLASAPVYHLDVTINENLERVHGRQQLRYVNTAGESLMELYFSLFPNLTDGRLQISSVLVDGQPVHHELIDDVFVRVELPYRLRSMDTAVVQMDFRLDVGQTQQVFKGALNTTDNSINLMHFHPQLVPYSQEYGWDLSLPVHGIVNAANSYYRVRVNAPADLTIITSGSQVTQDILNNGQQNSTYAAAHVASFYITASKDFVVQLSATVGETTIHSYAMANDLQADAQKALDIAVRALRIFNNQFGAYPYTELDLVGTSEYDFELYGMNYTGVSVHGTAL